MAHELAGLHARALLEFLAVLVNYAAIGISLIWWKIHRIQRFAMAPMITLVALPRAAIEAENSRQRGS